MRKLRLPVSFRKMIHPFTSFSVRIFTSRRFWDILTTMKLDALTYQ
ncbi:hypothetical protein CF65_00485 [Aggregatibacter actinomycetemcomitans HK1651]|nr:hypothetical protein CF65_00485 [Aggregatibacter actinomycetemcomitans HK1651]